MKNFKKIIIFLFLNFLFFCNFLYSDNTYFIDFAKVLNQSKAGASAQENLKTKFENENKNFLKEENDLRTKERNLIEQKKVLSNEDYQKKLDALRKEVSNLQKNKQDSLNEIAKSRNKARQDLLKAVNPIIKKYMEQNSIRIVLDKQSIILGDTSLEITDKIIEILNKELTSLKIN
jgi:Skp family chaperone for outer membrane proteins